MGVITDCWKQVVQIWGASWQNTGIYALFAISLVYFFIKKTEKTNILLIYTVGVFFLFFNPFAYWIAVEILSLDTIYTRMLLCLPISVCIAYLFADYYVAHKEEHGKKLLILGILLIFLCGRCTYATDNVVKAENWHHIPQEAIQIVTLLENDAKNLSMVTVAMPNYPACRFVQLFNASFHMPYGRRGWMSTGDEADELFQHLDAGSDDYYTILTDAYICNCNYFVTRNTVPAEGFLSLGCRMVGETEHYIIYCMEDYHAQDENTIRRRVAYNEKWISSPKIQMDTQ